MKFSEIQIQHVKEYSDIRDFIPGVSRTKVTEYVKCPKCGKEGKGKGLCVTHKKDMDLAKCFSCGFTINGAIGAVIEYQHLSYLDAVEHVAAHYGIDLSPLPARRTSRKVAKSKNPDSQSFCNKQLAESGLTYDDVVAETIIGAGQDKAFVSPFRKGGVDSSGNYNTVHDEMLIYYYDLWGNAVTYATRGARGSLKPYVRVRWSNPELHLDRDGRPIKYQTPPGAPSKFYIPQYIRTRFLKSEHIETLFIQEGEKKAEKACKEGIPSIGIQGIYNIGNTETGLIQDLQYLVQKCSIRNIVLLMDADWDNLHKSLQIGDNVDQRPNQFSKAVLKFKQYVQTLHNVGLSVDVFFAHINKNENNDKGIDDLLTHTLRGRESELAKEIDKVLHSHDGLGQYIDIFKISSKTDMQIRDYWLLNDRDAFFDKYKEQLLQLSHFRFSRINYRVEDGNIIQAQKRASDRDFWIFKTDKNGEKKVEFDYIEALSFISANGFHRIHTADQEVDQYKFVRIDDGIVYPSGPSEIRDFVYHYALQATKDHAVHTMLASRLGNLLGSDKLERLTKIDDAFDTFEPHMQRLCYLNGQILISSRGIEQSDIIGQVWNDKVINRKFTRVPVIEDILFDPEKGFTVKLTDAGTGCEFMTFIQNISNFWFSESSPTQEDEKEFMQHVVNKITTIGYLLADYKYQSELKAVVAMDGQMGEVSQSNGRTGKSIIGVALGKMLEQTTIDGKTLKNDDDYIYSNVTLRTRNIFIDDVRVNFDFEKFFAAVTGPLNVNPKTKARFTIPNERSPKLYITTNHALNANDRSSLERIVYMAFSDWYNDVHRPIDDFGHQLFADWDDDQWNLFDNLMAECVMFYFRSMAECWYRQGQGAVPPPMRDIRFRSLRQQMGEAFFQWAEVYFDESGDNLNARQERKAMYDAYHAYFPDAKFGVTASNFKTKIILFCQFKGYHFNVSKPDKQGNAFSDWVKTNKDESFVGTSDKSGSVEYFSVFSTAFAEKMPF